MSCPDGVQCYEDQKRRRGLLLFGLMILVFIVLSGFSFLNSRGQVTPDEIQFGRYEAEAGKKVFQAYNCMGCHTMVGNGAYFAPDLTDIYDTAGPAWLAAFLPSAGGWPTEGAVKLQLANADIRADAGVTTIEEYYEKFPGAKERIQRRGGQDTTMPNLPFQADDVGNLIAYLKYTSAMDTEGWPPEIRTGSLARRLQLAHGGNAQPHLITEEDEPSAELTLEEIGRNVARNTGCMACHATDSSDKVGPGWGGLYNSTVTLTDNTTVKADEIYLARSITNPNDEIVQGYTKGIMPSYADLLTADEISAIVAYLRSLEDNQ